MKSSVTVLRSLPSKEKTTHRVPPLKIHCHPSHCQDDVQSFPLGLWSTQVNPVLPPSEGVSDWGGQVGHAEELGKY